MTTLARVRKRLEGKDHRSFVVNLLQTQADAVGAAGSESVANKMRKFNNDDKELVLKARFAMGANCGAYLRANTQALHAVDNDRTALADELTPEMELAGRTGLYMALEAHIKEQQHDVAERFEEYVAFCSWMLSIDEIHDFCLEYLSSEEEKTAVDKARERAANAIKGIAPNASSNGAADATTVAYQRRVYVCKIIDALMLLFGEPMSLVEKQCDHVLEQPKRLSDAQLRLANAAKLSADVYDADKKPIKPNGVSDIRIGDTQIGATQIEAIPALLGASTDSKFEPHIIAKRDGSGKFTYALVKPVGVFGPLLALSSGVRLPEQAFTLPEMRQIILADFKKNAGATMLSFFNGDVGRFVRKFGKQLKRNYDVNELLGGEVEATYPNLVDQIRRARLGEILPTKDSEGLIIPGEYTVVDKDFQFGPEWLYAQTLFRSLIGEGRPGYRAEKDKPIEGERLWGVYNDPSMTRNSKIDWFQVVLGSNDYDAQLFMDYLDIMNLKARVTEYEELFRNNEELLKAPRSRFAYIKRAQDFQDDSKLREAIKQTQIHARKLKKAIPYLWVNEVGPSPVPPMSEDDFRNVRPPPPPSPSPPSPEPPPQPPSGPPPQPPSGPPPQSPNKDDYGGFTWEEIKEEMQKRWPYARDLLSSGFAPPIIAFAFRNIWGYLGKPKKVQNLNQKGRYGQPGGEPKTSPENSNSGTGRGQGRREKPDNALAPERRNYGSSSDDKGDDPEDDPEDDPSDDTDKEFCGVQNVDDVVTALDGLCAAFSQMRGDGGLESLGDNLLTRECGLSPTWVTHTRQNDRAESSPYDEWWNKTIWRSGKPSPFADFDEFKSRLQNGADFNTAFPNETIESITQGEKAIAYCLARGLCAFRAPHQNRPSSAKSHFYNLPQAPFVEPQQPPAKVALQETSKGDRDAKIKSMGKTAFCRVSTATVDDFVRDDHDIPEDNRSELIEYSQMCEWIPATRVQMGSTKRFQLERNDKTKAVAMAVIQECLVDYYKRRASVKTAKNDPTTKAQRRLHLACAAATKILQLPHIATAMHESNGSDGERQEFVEAMPQTTDKRMHFFLTRPALRCSNLKVLYPCDAGVATYSVSTATPVKEPELPKGIQQVKKAADYKTKGIVEGTFTKIRRDVTISDATRAMRDTLGKFDNRHAPLYVAMPPGTSAAPIDVAQRLQPRNPRGWDSNVLPTDTNKLSKDHILEILSRAADLCSTHQQLDFEMEHIQRLNQEAISEQSGQSETETRDQLARLRRHAIWNDTLREVAISGDRLWAFVRQLSGTIHESVDAICQIDEGQLISQQREMMQRRQRAAEQAAREHMALVKNVFSSILREGGLTLGIGTNGADLGQFKVVASALRKQASELANRSSGDGFFTNGVQLEQLLAKGTGEITLNELFAQLRQAGVELQQAALSANSSFNGIADMGGSLEFLSAPRNSLVLRYKPEALAAIRQAHDSFQQEMRQHHWHRIRHITAYELIEGRSEELCTAFAAYSAHLLANARIFSSSLAPYVGVQPARANATQLQISLHKLIRAACNYVMSVPAPCFTSTEGRKLYFMGA